MRIRFRTLLLAIMAIAPLTVMAQKDMTKEEGKTKKRIESLLKKMTLREKIGQMNQVDMNSFS
jgi:hypothetical protein